MTPKAIRDEANGPWDVCPGCDKPLTRETTTRVVFDGSAFVEPVGVHTFAQIVAYYHTDCAASLFSRPRG